MEVQKRVDFQLSFAPGRLVIESSGVVGRLGSKEVCCEVQVKGNKSGEDFSVSPLSVKLGRNEILKNPPGSFYLVVYDFWELEE